MKACTGTVMASDVHEYLNFKETNALPYKRGLSLTSLVAYHCRSFYPGFCSMKRLKVLLLLLDGMLVHRR